MRLFSHTRVSVNVHFMGVIEKDYEELAIFLHFLDHVLDCTIFMRIEIKANFLPKLCLRIRFNSKNVLRVSGVLNYFQVLVFIEPYNALERVKSVWG